MNGPADTEVPPGSRLFVVCGRSVEEDVLRAAFRPYGVVQHVRAIRDKGVAYVKFDKASSAARAIEDLNGAVLNNGRGPKLKVLLAEAPTARGIPPPPPQLPDSILATDPDNVPPRSRLFLVVPKTAEARVIQDEASQFPDLEYVKTDLIAAKGVSFFKFKKASSALQAMEDVCAKGMLGPYKVKCMLAEPKTKRSRDAAVATLLAPQGKAGEMYGGVPAMMLDQANVYRLAASNPAVFGGFGLGDVRANGAFAAQHAAALGAAAAAAGEYNAALSQVPGLAGGGGFGIGAGLHATSTPLGPLSQQMSLGFANLSSTINSASTPEGAVGSSGVGGAFHSSPSPGNNSSLGSGSSALSTATFPLGYLGLSPAHTGGGATSAAVSSAGAGGGPQLSKQRLFVVVHKSVSEDVLARLFRSYPGMEYCDLKQDKATGRSKGYCYVNYSTPAAAAQAVADLNGAEFPLGSGFRIKVMPAEIMTGHTGGSSGGGMLRSANGGAGVAVSAQRPPRSPAPALAAGAGVVGAVGPSVQVGSGSTGPSPAHTPVNSSAVGSERVRAQDALGSMSLLHSAGSNDAATSTTGDVRGAAASLAASPLHTAVARELLFTST